MWTKTYDCIIVGSGPAGIFSALELIERRQNISILILEKGKNLKNRHCPSQTKLISCYQCAPCNITAGWGRSRSLF